VPALAHRLGIPLRVVEPEPWSLGVRFQEEPAGLHRYQVAAGSAADGTTVGDLPCGEDVWVSFVIRDGRLVPARARTKMRAGDEVLVLADDVADLAALFTQKEG
jgi:cell volume regulation protein A